MLYSDGLKYETIIYVFDGEKTLFIERQKPGKIMHGCFVPAGGGIEEQDKGDFGRCAIRELKEETGINALEIIAIGEILFDNSERDFGKGVGAEPNHKVYLFEATKYSGELNNGDAGKPSWVNWNNLNDLKMMPGDRLFHEWVRNRNGRYFVGQIKHNSQGIDEESTWVNYLDKL